MYGEEQAHKEREEKLNAMKANLSQAGCVGTSNGLASDMPRREGMYGRFRAQLDRARREGNKAIQLEELVYLLDKNPELARILELVDAIGNG